MKRRTAKSLKWALSYEEGSVAFWERLLAAIEADDGTAAQIVNDRIARAMLRRDKMRAALESGQPTSVSSLYRHLAQQPGN